MELTNSKTQIIISIIGLVGILGGALLANWEKVFPKERNIPQDMRKDASPPPQKDEYLKAGASQAATPQQVEPSEPGQSHLEIGETWRDIFGTIYKITQHGNGFDFVASNPINGYASWGSGTISGKRVISSFQTNMGSTGKCNGTVSTDGKQMTGSCYDTTLGQYTLTLYRY